MKNAPQITLLITLLLSSFTGLEPAPVTVVVNDVEEAKGEVIFMLFDQADGFPREPNKAYQMGKVPAQAGQVAYTFKKIPYGQYAIAVFHDADSDGEVSSNFIGIPKERVGATNVRGIGKPNFEKCLVTVDQPSVRLSIKFIN